MIGVWCEEHERGIASEFFELFKTPWEAYEPSREYDVVVATRAIDPAEMRAKLLVIFGSQSHSSDPAPEPGRSAAETLLAGEGHEFPIYGSVLTFGNGKQSLLRDARSGSTVAFESRADAMRVVRCGYNVFFEIELLLSGGQPVELAHIPTLDLHITMLRIWIARAGLPLVEIPPVPPGRELIVCLTHDVDFVGIKRHRLDRTMWGFVYRASIGSLRDLIAGRSSWRTLGTNVRALAMLPLVHAGAARDYWLDFDEYSELERELGATYFFIPFRGRPGREVEASHAARRAAPYDLDEVRPLIERLVADGFEIGVHGIDAWLSEDAGRAELERVAAVAGRDDLGIRMHWLCFDEGAPARLERAGYAYDATCGFNETVGFKAGTHQVFSPPGTRLFELPLHIEDTALFYPRRMHLREAEAWERCREIWVSAAAHGGVVTVLWHTRSLGPERLWRDFYVRLLSALRSQHAWFASAREVVHWFERRRAVRFESVAVEGDEIRVRLRSESPVPDPGLVVRVHLPVDAADAEGVASQPYVDTPWLGDADILVQVHTERAHDTLRDVADAVERSRSVRE